MFETRQFRSQLEERRGLAQRISGVRIADEVVDILRFLAMAHEEHLMLAEQRRPSWERQRGLADALESAGRLLEEAIRVTREQRLYEVGIDQLAAAYRKKFCEIWPFCR